MMESWIVENHLKAKKTLVIPNAYWSFSTPAFHYDIPEQTDIQLIDNPSHLSSTYIMSKSLPM